MAHELGHIALAHILGRTPSLEVSRNQEREADSFASSVVSTSPFGDYLVAGQIIWSLIMVWGEHTGNVEIATSHPLERERLMDFIRANEAKAASIGIDKQTIQDFLPPETQ